MAEETEKHQHNAGPEGDEREQSGADRVWIRIGPERETRRNDDQQQRRLTEDKDGNSDPEQFRHGGHRAWQCDAQFSVNSPPAILSSVGQMSPRAATRTVCKRPSMFSSQKCRNLFSTGKR